MKYRIFKPNGMAAADLICLEDETINTNEPLTIFHPEQTWKKVTYENYTVRELMVPIFKDGELVYKLPTLQEIGEYEQKCISEFFPEYRRVINTQDFKVDLSEKLWILKNKMLGSK